MAEATKRPAKKSTAQKSTATKSTAKKSTAKKTTARKAPAKKTAAKKSTDQKSTSSSGQSGGQSSSGTPSASKAALSGAEQLTDLTGKEFEGIVGIEKSDDGWSVLVEVLEMRRIPATTDVLALYEVDVDTSGDLVGYRRAERYVRGHAGEGGR